MIRPRISIRALCIVIALAAAECALFAPALGDVYFGLLINTVALPMISILLFIARRQRRLGDRGSNSPGLTGFQLVGAASLATVIAALIFVPGVYVNLVWTFDPARELALRMLGFRDNTYTTRNLAVWWCGEFARYLSVSFALTMTMILIAAIGGWRVSRRGAATGRSTHKPESRENIPIG